MRYSPTPRPLLFCFLLLALGALVMAPAQAQTSVPGFSKSFTPGTIGPGGVSTLRFDIVNASGSPIRNLDFTDNLPAGMTIATPAAASSTCLGGSLSAPAGGSSISYSGGGIGAGATCSVSVNVTAGAVGVLTNVSGNLTSDAGDSGNATADLTIAADRPGFSKSFSPSTILFGGRSTLTFTIDNSANGSIAANLRFTDNLPPNMVVASPANASTTCSGGVITAVAGSGVVTYLPQFFGDATVAAGATCTVSVDVVGNATGSLGNVSDELTSTAQFGGMTRSSGRASATLNVTVERITLSKSFLEDPVAPGSTVTLRFTARNLDRSSTATNLSFTDDLGAVLAGLAASGTPIADPCGSGSQLTGSSVLSLSGGSLPPGGVCTFDVDLQVPATAATGVYDNVTSAITADLGGRPVTGDPATDQLFVEPAPRLTKSFLDDPVGAGGSVSLEFTITNTSTTDTATDITFEDVFVVELPTASSVPSGEVCGTGSSVSYTPLVDLSGGDSIPAELNLTGGSLAPGESCSFTVTLDVASGAAQGTYPNVTSAITATLDGATLTGSPATDDLTVVGSPTLFKEFVDDPATPGGTTTLRFTIAHDELAPADATGITFSDDLDAALSGLVATGLPATDVCGLGSSISGTMTLLFDGGSLAPGESCSFDVTLAVPGDAPIGTHTNTTSAVVADVAGIQTMGRPATDDLRIAGLELSKEFIDDPALPGGTVTLRYTVQNQSSTSAATDIFFQDNLDQAVDGMSANGLPLTDPCGAGSSLLGLSGDSLLFLQGGSLAPGASCTFDVVLQIPASTVPETYVSTTSAFTATVDGSTVAFENASAELIVASDLLAFSKEFTDDPAGPGESVNLRFTITNLSATESISDIQFTDDLDAALSGLVSASGTSNDVCGVGSQISGTSLLSFTGGSLTAGASCSFDVSVTVPATVPLGTVATNVTSEIVGLVSGLEVDGPPATDELQIDFLTFSKSFSGAVEAGEVVTLTFSIANLSTTDGVSGLSFTDDLDNVLTGLTAIGLPANDVCGEGSILSGAGFLIFQEGSLLPGGSCTFSVDLQVPAKAEPGSYLNETSPLSQNGLPSALPATATLVILQGSVDDDGDGVLNGDDVCPGTVIPEGVPTRRLGTNRFALVDNDTLFDTVRPPGGGPGDEFTTTDTAGCSCEQIIEELELGNGHRKFGCSLSAMRTWVSLVGEGDQVSYER